MLITIRQRLQRRITGRSLRSTTTTPRRHTDTGPIATKKAIPRPPPDDEVVHRRPSVPGFCPSAYGGQGEEGEVRSSIYGAQLSMLGRVPGVKSCDRVGLPRFHEDGG